jgi:GrpB-like predicted nucleotidyltransferase (UPF0157 family)
LTSRNAASRHLYVCTTDSPQLARHLAFRDHPHTARAYAELKSSLAQRFRADRRAYTDAKTTFIERILEIDKERPGPIPLLHCSHVRA